jgi:hypothetical protein
MYMLGWVVGVMTSICCVQLAVQAFLCLDVVMAMCLLVSSLSVRQL